jgi:hypothetical protein
MFMEMMSLRSVPENQALEFCTAALGSGGKLADLPGETTEWARILLRDPDETTFPVRFTVFHERSSPVLAYRLAGPFMSASFASKGGACFGSVEQLIEALDCVGLPGKEICKLTHKLYLVTGSQLRVLRLGMPNKPQDSTENIRQCQYISQVTRSLGGIGCASMFRD